MVEGSRVCFACDCLENINVNGMAILGFWMDKQTNKLLKIKKNVEKYALYLFIYNNIEKYALYMSQGGFSHGSSGIFCLL